MQTCPTHSAEPVIIVGLCNAILAAPFLYLHSSRTVLTRFDLLLPFQQPVLVCTIVVIEHIDYPPDMSKELSFQLLRLVLKV